MLKYLTEKLAGFLICVNKKTDILTFKIKTFKNPEGLLRGFVF